MKTTEDAEDAEDVSKSFQFPVSSFQKRPARDGNACVGQDYFVLRTSAFVRRWRASSYITMPPATETFSEGTLPSIGIETTKSHLRRTRSCNPFPSAPRTMAQSML